MEIYAASAQQLEMKTRISVAGLNCSVATNSDCLADMLARLWPVDQRRESGTGFGLRLVIDQELTSKQEVAPHFRGSAHLVFAWFHQADFFVFDLVRRSVTGVVSAVTARDAHFWKTVLIPIALGVLGTSVNRVPLHSACLAKDGVGILLAGVSGAGKSTLSVALAKRGFEFISDDWTYVARTEGGVSAYGLQIAAKLLPDCCRFFPELTALEPAIALNGELAFEVDPSAVFGFDVGERCSPRYLFFIERTKTGGESMQRLSPEVAREYFNLSAERLPEEVPELEMERRFSIETVCSCECWKVTYSGSPDKGAALIDEFIIGRRS